MPLETNPFAILTFIAAPAVLTNASSVLALGTSNRFARAVDRSRQLIRILESKQEPPRMLELYRDQLPVYERRATLLVRALSAFYFAIGCFAAGSLLSLLGAILASAGDHPHLLRPLLTATLLAGVAGLSGLIMGGGILVRETRVALQMVSQETRFYREQVLGQT